MPGAHIGMLNFAFARLAVAFEHTRCTTRFGVTVPIDDPIDFVSQQYPEDPNMPYTQIAFGASEAALAIPFLSPFAVLLSFLDSFNTSARLERAQAFVDVLIQEFRALDQKVSVMGAEVSEIHSALRLALANDLNEFNDAKRSRYISVVTHTVSSDTKIHDVSSFIQDVERLGERDLIGLRVLNAIMNKKGDWNGAVPASNGTPTLHPNTFIQRDQEFSLQMAKALKGDKLQSSGNNFSREDGLQICLRLQGFGLAQMIDVQSRQVPITNYSARLTTRGMMLLKLLGEEVPNWTYYFDKGGAL